MPDCIIRAIDVDSLSFSQKEYVSCQVQMVSECPMCHCGIQPVELSAYYVETANPYHDAFNRVLVEYFCQLCRAPFLCEYVGLSRSASSGPDGTEFLSKGIRSMTPVHPVKNQFSENIKQLSPRFVNIFSQAQIAESENLSELCGMGYRKALEFLTKDYLIHKFPDDADAIQGEVLGNSINRIADTRIKTLAARSAWIGNDEAHYVRRHEDLSFCELKAFVSAMLYYVDSELMLERAESISRK